MNPKWFVIAIEMEFYKNIDKLLRDNFKYVQCCLLCLIEQVATISPSLITKAQQAYQQQVKGLPTESTGVQAVLQGSKKEFSLLKGDLTLILALQEMVATSSFKQKIVKPQFIEMLAQVIDSPASQDKQLEEFRRATFGVVESLAKHSKILNQHHQIFLDKLLPALANKIESQSADTRFLALKVFTDYVTQFMCEDKIYQPQENTQTTQVLNELILKKFLANYGLIVTDQEPMPLYGLKLLSVILERNAAFVIILKKLQLTAVLLDYFQAGHAKFNAFTVKIVRAMVASREISIEELLQHDIIAKLNKIMQDVVQNNAEWASDHLLIIMNEILHLAADLKKNDAQSKIPQQVFSKLLTNFKFFSKLLTASDISIVEGASFNMLAFIHFSMLQGIEKNDTELFLQEQQVQQFILPAFKLEKTNIAKNLLKSLYWALTLGTNPLKLTKDQFAQLQKIAEGYVQSDDKSISNTARELVKICKQIPSQNLM